MPETSNGKNSSRISSSDSDKERDQTRMQEFLLPVHGFVKLYPEEVALVDHQAFQRLRRMRQLGFAHMVFPGGTHTRFEHSIGAVHVAQAIMDNVRDNFSRHENAVEKTDWRIDLLDYPTERLIRLGALLHDIGHLPFGHTLEDELNHLPPHDGRDRLSKIANIRLRDYELDHEILPRQQKPQEGWCLEELVNVLYHRHLAKLCLDEKPFDVLSLIVCKRPKNVSELATWEQLENRVNKILRLKVCQDIVGNTICADFLDYLFRDWHHLGKPQVEDKRLYQYMEVRVKKLSEKIEQANFVINIGTSPKIRHDALTDILDLLGLRYKLAETVLFHRTKLAIIALLDRCLLEIREVYREADVQDLDFLQAAEELLIKGADDSLRTILDELTCGGTSTGKQKVQDVCEDQRRKVEAAIATGALKREDTTDLLAKMEDGSVEGKNRSRGELEAHLDFVYQLNANLENRCVYTLAYKLQISDFPGVRSHRLKAVIEMYRDPQKRLRYLRGVEALCSLPPGSLTMYCPPDSKMNAKIAKVNLLIEGNITPFYDYEESLGDASLTHGALKAQVKRFEELWSTHVFIEPTCWDGLTPFAQQNLKIVLREFFFQMRSDSDPKISRRNVDESIKCVLSETVARAARSGTKDPRLEKFKHFEFPSGLKFEVEEK